MLANYLTIAARNLYKRKFFSFINAFGLSISIAFCGLIFLYIVDERSFDKFHTNGEDIYRIEELSYNQWSNEEGISFDKSAYLQTPLIPVIKEEIPQVVHGTRYNQNDECIIQHNTTVFEETVTFVDPDFFLMFSFTMLEGNPEKVFEGLHSAVITPEIAHKYFGNVPALDNTLEITINGVTNTYIVTGIIEKHPANSSISYDVLVPQANRPYYDANMDRWNSFNTPGFVQLQAGSDPEDLAINLESIEEKYLSENIQRWKEESELPENIDPFSYITTRLTDIHLNTSVDWEKRSDPQYAYILGGIGLLILIIACINYVSLSLSTSVSRQTEVGIRKAIGAFKNQLFIQFTIESVLLAFVSMLIGLALLALFLPYFNDFTGKAIALDPGLSLQVFMVSLVLSFLIGFLSGGYPAMFLSAYRPAIVLKSGKSSRLKAGFTVPLVLVQFSLSAMLIICSLIMFRQMKFITTKDLGYNADQIVVIPTQSGFNSDSDRLVNTFRQTAENSPSVMAIAGTSMSFNRGWSRYGYTIEGEEKFAYVYGVDPHYLPLLDLALVMGRNFSEYNAADSNSIIVNESLVKDMGWDSPLDEYLNWREDSIGMGDRIIGVVKDYHFLSLEEEIQPVFLSINTGEVGHLTEIMVKLKAGMITEGINDLRSAWSDLVTDKPFNYTFLDENVASQYATYERWMNIMGLATVFAILISCLGLFGLSGINAVNRTKEIGIRKAMGAETWNIFILLNRQFIWLSLVAFAIAAPLSWYLMNQWLDSFKYVITISWDIFAISIVTGLIIALLTVSYHAVRAANINPADTLKYE